MRLLRALLCAVPLAALCLAVVVPAPANANGGKAKMLRLEDRVPMDGGRTCQFLAEIDPTLFRLVTLNGRYKAVRIQVRNDSRQAVILSRTTDTADVVFAERTVPGIMTLDTRDAALWDTFSTDLRRALAYPARVEAGEEESVFVFVPVAGIDAPPKEIRLQLAGLPRPVKLRELVAMAGS